MNVLIIGMCGNSLFYEKETNTLLKEEPGGKGYNQAVGLAKLGGKVSFLGAIGNDISGDKCSLYLDSLNINNLLIRKNVDTTYANIFVDKDGNNDVQVSFGAKLTLSDLNFIKLQIDNHDLIMLQNEIDKSLNIEILKYCYEKNKMTLVNPAPVASWMSEYLKLINFITPNEIEARQLFNIPSCVDVLEIGKYLLNIKVSNVLVTLGSHGSVLVKEDCYKYFPPIKVVAIDTTGAGDLMNACIAFGFQNNLSLEDSITLGTKACAYSVTKRFVLDSYPTIDEIN